MATDLLGIDSIDKHIKEDTIDQIVECDISTLSPDKCSLFYSILSQMTSLEKLLTKNLQFPSSTFHIFVESLCNCHRLRSLTLISRSSKCDISEYNLTLFLDQLNNWPNLQEIDFSHNHIKYITFRRLMDVIADTKIETVILAHNDIGDAETDYPFKKKLTHLKKFDLSYNKLTPAVCSAIRKLIRTALFIEEISLRGNKKMTSDGIKVILSPLRNFGFVKTIDLTNCDLNEDSLRDALEVIRTIKSIESFQVMGKMNFGSANSYSDCLLLWPNITSLIFPNCGLDTLSVIPLCESLKHCSHISVIDFSNNEIGNNGISALFRHLKFLENLKKLYIQNNPFDEDVYFDIAENLSCCKYLEVFDMSTKIEYKEIEDEYKPSGLAAIAKQIKSTHTLKSWKYPVTYMRLDTVSAIEDLQQTYPKFEFPIVYFTNIHMGNLADIVHNYSLHSTKEFTFCNINNEKMFKHMIYVLHYLDGLKLIRFENCIFGNFFNVKEFIQVSNKMIALEIVNCHNLPSTILNDIIKRSVKLSFLTVNYCQLYVNDILGLINTIQHMENQITGLYLDSNMSSQYGRIKVPYPFCAKRKIEKALKECGIFDYRI